MLAEWAESSLWLWVGRVADLISLAGIFGILLYLRRLSRRLFSRRRIEATPLGINSGFKGLICCVSAPLPPDKAPEKNPEYIEELVRKSGSLTAELLEGPIGSILKAIQHHKRDLRHCWLIASEDSKPYFGPLKHACQKYFPEVNLHDPITVADVYAKIDGVYNAAHEVFHKCEEETNGQVRQADIITDVTGGTKIMSIAVAMACLDRDRQIQYIEQKERKTFYRIDITWEKIVRRPARPAP